MHTTSATSYTFTSMSPTDRKGPPQTTMTIPGLRSCTNGCPRLSYHPVVSLVIGARKRSKMMITMTRMARSKPVNKGVKVTTCSLVSSLCLSLSRVRQFKSDSLTRSSCTEPNAAGIKPGRRQDGLAQAEKQPTTEDIFIFSCSAHLALSALEKLDFLFPLGGYHEGRLDVLARISIYTDKRDPWSNNTGSYDAAKRLIGKYVPSIYSLAETPTLSSPSSPAVAPPASATVSWSSSRSSPYPITKSDLFDHILAKIVKPIFARTRKNPDVTSQGRKAMSTNLNRTKHERSGGGVVFGKEEKSTKPWKYDKRYILTIIRYLLLNMDGHMKVCLLWLNSLHSHTLLTLIPSLYPADAPRYANLTPTLSPLITV